MSKESDFFSDGYLFTVHNMCGEYEVSMPYSLEHKLSYVIRARDATYEEERDTPPEKALPYLQEICDKAIKEDWGLEILIDELEKFGDPHYSPIPWEQEPLPEGAIE
jgi:hypothetical protein